MDQLTFIGQDGSMGLKHGETYDCFMDSYDEGRRWIWLSVYEQGWYEFDSQPGHRYVPTRIPYSSTGALMKNWALQKP